MGIYLNPGNELFAESLRSQIYVDKTGLISYTNRALGTRQKCICVSRPRRFGKSMAAEMLAAYYGTGCDSREMFQDLEIWEDSSFEAYLNQYDVLFLNMQDFLSRAGDAGNLMICLQETVLKELKTEFPAAVCETEDYLPSALEQIYQEEHRGFVIIIDEWDCLFRVRKQETRAQSVYLDCLRALLKDKAYVKLAYMTGILPIKKYGR